MASCWTSYSTTSKCLTFQCSSSFTECQCCWRNWRVRYIFQMSLMLGRILYYTTCLYGNWIRSIIDFISSSFYSCSISHKFYTTTLLLYSTSPAVVKSRWMPPTWFLRFCRNPFYIFYTQPVCHSGSPVLYHGESSYPSVVPYSNNNMWVPEEYYASLGSLPARGDRKEEKDFPWNFHMNNHAHMHCWNFLLRTSNHNGWLRWWDVKM